MSTNFRDLLHVGSEQVLREHVDDLDRHHIVFPKTQHEVNDAILKEKLEKITLARDTLLRVERLFREDVAALKMLANDLKAELKLDTAALLAEDDRKLSVEVKKAAAQAKLKDQIREINEVENWQILIEGSLTYLESKKADLKQKNSDIKMLYKIYETDKNLSPSGNFFGNGWNTNPQPRTAPRAPEKLHEDAVNDETGITADELLSSLD